MIKVTEAKSLIKENCTSTKVEQLFLREAQGYVLAEPAYSLIDTPPFNQSAMDGYAFSFAGWDKKNNLMLKGEIQAGNIFGTRLNPMEAVRIFTGAAIPDSADTVVVQEKVIAFENSISISDAEILRGSNVRPKGSQTKKNEIILHPDTLLTPAAISFLAGAGIDKVNVYSKPSVSIIITGKELLQPGTPMGEGKIYESNSYGLVAALSQLNISPASLTIVDDDESKIKNAIQDRLSNDIIILTGGISVGDYDFVAGALAACGVTKIFHKVKQKPGKPFYFGKHNQTLIFALPGNPAAVLSCFYEYVVPAISSFTMKEYFRKLKLPLTGEFRKKSGLTFFLKGKTNPAGVSILDSQESYLLNSFAMADCIIELSEEKDFFEKGDLVKLSMII